MLFVILLVSSAAVARPHNASPVLQADSKMARPARGHVLQASSATVPPTPVTAAQPPAQLAPRQVHTVRPARILTTDNPTRAALQRVRQALWPIQGP